MSRFLIAFAFLFLVAIVAGCGSSEPTVVMPTETYQPTEVEQANAEREAAEREAENR